jgi:hypothetical protein|tara:strand:- start:911 stop:1753 length:843 start_codon:yes stop_codon:yes gene_type:complete
MIFRDLGVRERIETIEEMAKTPGYIVLDSSLICNLIETHRDYKKISPEEELDMLKGQIDLTRRLRYCVSDNDRFVFPEEIRNELESSAKNYMVRKRRSRRRTGRRRAFKGNGEQKRNDFYSYFKELGKAWGDLIHERTKFVADTNYLEDRLPELERGMLEDFETTVMDLSDKFYDSNMRMRAKRLSEGADENRYNDEKILAKSFALSEVMPVTVVSRDWDFKSIYSAMFRNLDRFIDNGIPGLPAFNLDLLIFDGKGSFQYFNPVMFAPDNLKRRFRLLA